MNIYDSIIAIKDHLSAHGLTVSVDPYAEVDPPFVLVEAEKTVGTESSGSGGMINGYHVATITCIVNAHITDFTTYKHDLADLVNNVLGYLTDPTTVIVKPIEITYDELMIGSLRCSGAVISAEVYPF